MLLVSKDSISISAWSCTYWSIVPSKWESRFAVDGSAIMYFSTSSYVLNLLIRIFFLNRFLTISLNDILSSIVFILFAFAYAKALAIGYGYGARGNIASSSRVIELLSVLFDINSDESRLSGVLAYIFYLINYLMLLVLCYGKEIASLKGNNITMMIIK